MLKAEFIEDKLGRPQDDEISILLAHNPKYFQEYVEWGGTGLVCAGHIHGGVVRLPLRVESCRPILLSSRLMTAASTVPARQPCMSAAAWATR